MPSPRPTEDCHTRDWIIVSIAIEIKGSCVEYDYNPPQYWSNHLSLTWDLHAIGNATGQ